MLFIKQNIKHETNYSGFDAITVYGSQTKIVVVLLIVFSFFNNGPQKHNGELLNP